MNDPVAIYVHTPFCPSKCGYCDFNSYALSGDIMARTSAATIQEIQQSPHRGRPAKTVFFGGGTPTYLPTGQLTAILEAIVDAHPPIEGCEITSEANPGTIDFPKFKAMREAGFNRLSLGAQSFQTHDLIQLGRIHAPDHVAQAVAKARAAGFDNLNLDLMFALPGQSLRAWRQNLETALALRPEHLSLYCLTIEPNTRFYRHHLRGLLDLPGEELQIAMYDVAIEACEGSGLYQYEISNFAKTGRQCRHNLEYWHAREYLAYGPGAVGCHAVDKGKFRYTNMKHPERYCEAIEQGLPLHCDTETLAPEDEDFERIMLGLRLNAGLPSQNLALDSKGLQTAAARGWIDRNGDKIILTGKGRHFCSEVAVLLSPG
ncbi:MAG: radical SAM family heme chaperone HemW [Armatimonadetes bacterium]|nr:radical SAM family heme chaperone HemW [Armatimonadota bacterium]MBX3107725.1 radical SAM family heme chaperone HemW [Fimbriimonadaceae bacterium]